MLPGAGNRMTGAGNRMTRAGNGMTGAGNGMTGAGNGISATLAADYTPSQPERFRLTLGWLDVLALAVALILVLGFVHPMAASAPTLRGVVETAMTLFALAAARLTYEQFLVTRRLRQLLLLAALLTLALLEVFGGALPAIVGATSGRGFTAALPFGYLIVAITLALAAVTPSERVVGRGRPVARTAGLSVLAFALAEGAGILLHQQLLAATGYGGSGLRWALNHPLGLVVMTAVAGVLLFAAIQFAAQARLEGSDVLSLLAGAAILLAGARLYFLALPVVSPDSVSIREALTLLAFVMIFGAALRRDFELRSVTARAAALAERRRVAQDLHDGLAQDLALIVAHEQRLAEQMGNEHPVVVAARRALALSRRTISDLSDPSATSTHDALESVAQDLRERFGVRILVDAHPGVQLSPDARDQVARIVREAIANAVRHGGAENIVVSLKPASDGASLRVSDDGRGIDRPAGAAPEGFGIRSMRERAASLGGVFTLRPRGGRGTELEVILP